MRTWLDMPLKSSSDRHGLVRILRVAASLSYPGPLLFGASFLDASLTGASRVTRLACIGGLLLGAGAALTGMFLLPLFAARMLLYWDRWATSSG